MQWIGLASAVDDTSFVKVTEGAGLQEIKQCNALAGEHYQIGLHVAPKHFHPIGIFAGLLFVDRPIDGTGLLVKFIALENHLMIAVLFIRQSP